MLHGPELKEAAARPKLFPVLGTVRTDGLSTFPHSPIYCRSSFPNNTNINYRPTFDVHNCFDLFINVIVRQQYPIFSYRYTVIFHIRNLRTNTISDASEIESPAVDCEHPHRLNVNQIKRLCTDGRRIDGEPETSAFHWFMKRENSDWMINDYVFHFNKF